MLSRLRWHLHELDPDWDPAPRSLRSRKNLDSVAARLAADVTARITALSADISDLENDIAALVRQLAPSLLALPGVRRCVPSSTDYPTPSTTPR